MVQNQPGESTKSIRKINLGNKKKKAEDVARVVEHLPKALSLNPNITKIKRKERRNYLAPHSAHPGLVNLCCGSQPHSNHVRVFKKHGV
jgi:hypothetical protein